MSSAKRDAGARRLAEQLERSRLARLRQYDEQGMRPECRTLAAWQAARLRHTYHDLLETSRYRKAVEFFLNDLYGDKDFSSRDEGVERVYPIMARVMPGPALMTISIGIELHAISQELDLDMVAMIWGEMELQGELDAATYAEAYRRCGNLDQRRRQISIVREVGQSLDAIVFKPFIYSAVKLAHGPAQMAGLLDLHMFIERGFVAFRAMKGSEEFIDTIVTRETAIMEAILAEEPVAAWAPPGDPAHG
ncbi:hypothetical protein [Thioalkalivibrio sp. XN8]|uniref:FFLEELY motif protein n=1 Tax=Thioalkalivibrio sp. XN8 TaxID=2712863 RepID=UPI0013EB0301|nr:hypothetical protein [Thioalkalivibrio sp. XN8]NGP52405.1 hypothetical protein [Thioalkalivibrio sp. XN8]